MSSVLQMIRKRKDAADFKKIFLGGIPSDANEVQLHLTFEQHFGPVSRLLCFQHVVIASCFFYN